MFKLCVVLSLAFVLCEHVRTEKSYDDYEEYDEFERTYASIGSTSTTEKIEKVLITSKFM